MDAVRAYKAGALRASLTSAWVAVVYDLIAMYRELSALGDAGAHAFIQAWDAATAADDVKRLLRLESDILNDAAEVTQVINPIARTHLGRLRDDRHLCAHPAFSTIAELFEPSPELARLHLVNAVGLVLSQEPLQGKAILEQFDADVLSPGFPIAEDKVLDYVEQRYLARVRSQNIFNFGAVLAKSMLKGVPGQWEPQQRKITCSLIALRERASQNWQDVFTGIVRLIDGLEPGNRPRAIAFIAAFPEFWPRLSPATRTVLEQTAANVDPATLTDYRIFAGVGVPPLRDALVEVIERLDRDRLASAIAAQPLLELWPRALSLYERSGGYRGSEANFRNFVAPFAGRLSQERHDQLLDAILNNPQNWDAGETDALLLSMLRNAAQADWPSHDARDRFCAYLHDMGRPEKYAAVIALLQSDGWEPPAPPPGDDA